MPRIDPLSLLKCLSVLLGPTGGIKSKDEVHRLANLMTKFSKKLVSKCIYIQILKTTNTELLSQFMTAGGWNLVHSWLSDGIVSKNWALLQELLELLLLCPVDIERLKSNNCPKLIKGLSKEAKDLTVRSSAGKLVDQWLKLVKSEVTPHPVTPNIKLNIDNETTKNQTITINDNNEQETNVMISKLDDDSDDNDNNINNDATVEMNDLELKNNCVELIDTNNINDEQDNNNDEEVVEEEEEEVEEVEKNLQEYQNADKQINVKPVQFKIINKTLPGQSQPTQISKQSFVVYPAAKNKQPVGPVYKIIIKDGKQLLKKVDTVPKNLKKVYNNDIDINNDNELCDTDVVDNENSFIVDNCEVKKITNINNIKSTTIDNTDNNNSDVNKSNDKENRDSRKKNDDKITTSSSSSTAGTTTASDKKHSSQSSSSSKSKHSSSSSSRSSSSSHRSSSHRSSSSKSSSSSSSKSSRDRDRHHSSSSKHGSSSSSSSSSRSKTDKDKEKDKDKDKDKDKKDQAEKDKATLEKIQGQSLSTKFGKIPKKKSDDDKNDTTLRKSSTDSRDSSKENKDNKKITSPSSSSSSSSTTTTNSNSNSILEKKNISISIENRKNSTDQPRPKTVKTFNSKFRSTGLEEEVKPPPSKSSIKKPNIINDNKKLFQPKLSLKRPSPLRDTPISDKKIKLSLEPPTPTGEEKKGAIKLIAPKPKPMVLQESDMFMDALMTASTKGKEPRKRKRRTSLTKDDKNDTKKSDGTNEQGGKDDESPASPPPSEKSPLPVKPDFKFYQDTLETDEDKEEKEKSQDDDESQDDNDKNRTNSSGGGDDDDERSQTPTNDDDSSDKKHSPLSPDSEVRYVDGLRSVLVIQKRKGPKKLLKWNTELESIRYFELDETERVNVTKTFTDMKQMEKQGEREAFQMARKLSTEDTMEEKIKWRVLIPLDLPPALVDPGKDSKERDIQYAREKSILQALYFNRGMIPDSPAEPDEERHHVFKDPIIIPLDDLTGNKESEKDFSMLSWPEPKPKISIPPPSIIPQQQIITQNQQLHYQQFTQHNQMLPPNMQNGPMQQQIPPNIMSLNTINELNNTNTGIGGGGGWRTGDGKVVVPDVNIIGGGNNIPGQFVSGLDPLIMAPTMIPPPNLYHQQPPDNFNGFMGNDDNNFGHMQNNFQGPPGIFNNNNNNSNFRGGSGGNNNNGGGGGNGVMMANRGRGGNIPVWFRGGPPGTGGPGGLPPGGPGGPGPMRGVWNNGGRGNWRNNGKPVCRQFVKNGFCRVGDKCQYFHPGPNCPPF